MNSTQMALTALEYERVYQVIYSVLQGRANTPHACVFFATAGSLVLNKHHNLPARPVAGAFILRPGQSDNILLFATQQSGLLTSSRDGFHCWVQTRDYVIDFMAPIFEESFRSKGHEVSIPRRMFQRRLSEEAASIDTLPEDGGYFTLPNPDLTKELVDEATNRAGHVDLLCAVDRWYKKPPDPLESLALISEDGMQVPLILTAPRIIGEW